MKRAHVGSRIRPLDHGVSASSMSSLPKIIAVSLDSVLCREHGCLYFHAALDACMGGLIKLHSEKCKIPFSIFFSKSEKNSYPPCSKHTHAHTHSLTHTHKHTHTHENQETQVIGSHRHSTRNGGVSTSCFSVFCHSRDSYARYTDAQH